MSCECVDLHVPPQSRELPQTLLLRWPSLWKVSFLVKDFPGEPRDGQRVRSRALRGCAVLFAKNGTAGR